MIHLRKDYDRIQDPSVGDPSLLSPGSTPIGKDEPVFLLRGKDPAAATAVLAWASAAEGFGADPQMVKAVRDWACRMFQWCITHTANRITPPDTPIDQLKV